MRGKCQRDIDPDLKIVVRGRTALCLSLAELDAPDACLLASAMQALGAVLAESSLSQAPRPETSPAPHSGCGARPPGGSGQTPRGGSRRTPKRGARLLSAARSTALVGILCLSVLCAPGCRTHRDYPYDGPLIPPDNTPAPAPHW